MHASILQPAPYRRAFLLFLLAAVPAFAAVPPTRAPELSQAGKASPAEAARLLQQFRNSGIPGEYFLNFELHAMPRRAEERVFAGRLWGTRNAQGALTRVELTDAAGKTHRFLIQNGERPSVSRFSDGKVATLGVAQLFEPLLPGVEVTAFDVQMPFLYWPDATLEKISRVRGRPANAFFFRAPALFGTQNTEVTAARAYLDTQFNQLMQTELLGKGGRLVKTFGIVNLKKVGELYVPKSADYRNEITRDKARLVVTGAAFGLKLPPETFDVNSLARDAAVPPAVTPVE